MNERKQNKQRIREKEKRQSTIFFPQQSISFRMQRTSQAIPFKVPLYEDPRTMSKQTLISRLNDRNLNTNGTIEVLTARLLKAVVEEGLSVEIDPHLMDDRQPEKWTHIANLAFREAGNSEPNPQSRVETMTRSNAWINANIHGRQQLTEVARG
jgi:hypothetical protein